MPRTSNRETLVSDVLSVTNKPRFCYMGYAPPLCIGDEFDKRAAQPATDQGNKAILVPFPKKGSGPDALFSSPTPLCIGDPLNSVSSKKTTDQGDRPRFKPAGRTPDNSHKIPYMGNPETRTVIPARELKERETLKGFVVNTSNKLFTPVQEYMTSDFDAERKQLAAERKVTKEKWGDVPPFRLGGRIPVKHPEECLPVDKPMKEIDQRIESNDKPPFKSGGGRVPQEYPEHLPDPLPVAVRRAVSETSKPSWRVTSVPLVTSPQPSIVFNKINIMK
jgi:hypothetical protein